ncbi:MAG: phosphatidylserine decarboxylase [Syntrophorhabdus sp. PtaU1.Bin153]|nr:MAG: phosphatidylserine decarboxylase [Syntrophorhabdus sp. PtaU1.Bin153]
MKFIIPSLFLSILSYIFFFYPLSIASFLFFLFCLFFFRNPRRFSKEPRNCLVSPADGKVVEVKDAVGGEFVDSETTQVSIFMSLSNVHVNRAPCDGLVTKVVHRQGRFALAWKQEVDKVNERNYILLEGEDKILVVQIAGFLARRITCYVSDGAKVRRGDPVGIIAFGSRVDVYIPKTYECMVKLGQKVKAGITPVAKRRGNHGTKEA